MVAYSKSINIEVVFISTEMNNERNENCLQNVLFIEHAYSCESFVVQSTS